MRTSLTSVLMCLLVGCSSGTDITRSDDDVERWVEEQRQQEQARKQSAALPTPPPGTAPAQPAPPPEAPMPCSATWYDQVEAKLHVLDDQGHGPDLGSAEWKSAVEHKLGVQDDDAFPALGTPAWCERVERLVLPR